MKRIALFGSTGSIGEQVLNVIEMNADLFSITTLSCQSNIEKLLRQVELFNPKAVAVVNREAAGRIGPMLPVNVALFPGNEGVIEMIDSFESDMVFNAVVGFAGLKVTLASISKRVDIALANKESLVCGGELVMRLANQRASIVPVDSEHSAIFQCLKGESFGEIEKIIITASGGPFRGYSPGKIKEVTVSQTLAHPTWSMGERVTVDSASLMNKGMEVIEAVHLFGIDQERIEVMVHPQSIVHSMVEFADGSILAHLGKTDMRIPIQYALTHPKRLPSYIERIDFSQIGRLDFERPDTETFPCLEIARESLKIGGIMPAVMNAADEIAVKSFLEQKIGFQRIPDVISRVMGKIEPKKYYDLEELDEVDAQARRYAVEIVSKGV